jgi:predicted nuclease with RNAse H fold
VGGTRKGFHLAVLGPEGLVLAGERIVGADEAARRVAAFSPALVAVDAPRRPAEPGERSRRCERALVAAGPCALRYTPDLAELRANPFHGWVLRGLELYAALDRAGLAAVECFPTAAWTVWGGPRGSMPRSAWSARTLGLLGVAGVPRRLGQDGRDAIAAALTARLHTLGRTRVFGEIVLPAAPAWLQRPGRFARARVAPR